MVLALLNDLALARTYGSADGWSQGLISRGMGRSNLMTVEGD